MVESTQNQEDEGEEKTFLEQPDILDKIKAAALITDGNYYHLVSLTFNIFSCARKGSRTCSPRG